ncbi:UNVERIFIED_ORG: hypothetical protein J2S79_000786 [Pantoea agglomerans]
MAMEIKALEQRIHALFSQSILPLLVTESSLKGGSYRHRVNAPSLNSSICLKFMPIAHKVK